MGGWVAGWVVDFIPIIKPLRGPTCKLKTSKISTQVEVASWARMWQFQDVLEIGQGLIAHFLSKTKSSEKYILFMTKLALRFPLNRISNI